MGNISKFQFQEMLERTTLARHPQSAGAGDKNVPEKKLHVEIMDYCDRQWPRWKYIHSRMDKPTCNERGVPDFVIFLPGGKLLVVECKRPGSKISPAQGAWLVELASLGWSARVVHTMAEFLKLVPSVPSVP